MWQRFTLQYWMDEGLSALVVVCTLSALSASFVLAQDASPRPPDALVGREIYAPNCAVCHGQTGGGDGPSASGLGVPPAAFADYNVIAGRSPAELFQITKTGRMDRMMPPWGSRLTDQQIWDTVAYVWTLHTSATEVAMGKAVYETNCATCHSADGKGHSPKPDFTDFAATSVASQTAWAQVVADGRGAMPAFGDKISAAEQRAALEYVRSLSFGPLFRGPLVKGTSVITGTVTNGTAGGPVPNLAVTLHIFDGTNPLETHQATADAAGVYRFEELPADATDVRELNSRTSNSFLTYAVTAAYPAGANVPYGTELASFQAGQTTLNLPLTVYETTADGAGVRTDRVHLIVEFDAGQMLVAELYLFSLDGNRAYVGDGTGILRFILPTGAQGLEISDGALGERYLQTADGFVDTLPLPPGQAVRQVLFRYTLPITGDKLDLARTLSYPTANVNALIAEKGAQVSSQQLPDKGVRQTANGNYITLSGQNLAAGQAITLRFAGLTAGAGGAAPGPAGVNHTVLLIAMGLAGVGAGLLAAWPLLRRRTTGSRKTSEGSLPPASERKALVDALARLDLAHEAGELSDAVYRDQRLRLKAQLLDLAREEEQTSK